MTKHEYPKCPSCNGNLFTKNLEISGSKVTTWNCRKCDLQLKIVFVGNPSTGESIENYMVSVGDVSITFPRNADKETMIRVRSSVVILTGKHKSE